MAKDLISKKTRYEFREHFVNWTLREIEMEFDAADVSIDNDYRPPTSGQRRTLVEKYYHSIDWTSWSDVRKVLAIFENTLAGLEGQINKDNPLGTNEWAERKFHQLKKWVEKDGFRYSEGKLIPVGGYQPLQDFADTTAGFDAPELHRQIERMQDGVED